MKATFGNWWRWSNLSEWGGGDRHPDAVRLPDGVVVGVAGDDFQVAMYQHLEEHPRSKARYAPMTDDGSVRLLCEGGSDGGFAKAEGRAWARTTVITPHGSTFLYGGECPDCGDMQPLSESPDAPSLCNECATILAECVAATEEPPETDSTQKEFAALERAVAGMTIQETADFLGYGSK